ncbi:NINE protein [Paenibacillus allorhizosphaerae]|nr:NINE protein [Paenibacillus allorhizosphaerae]
MKLNKRVLAALLAIFLGSIGAHRFFLGRFYRQLSVLSKE